MGFTLTAYSEQLVEMLKAQAMARADERSRIREELLAWLVGDRPEDAGIVCGRRVVPEIDRICPTAAADALREITRLYGRLQLSAAERDRMRRAILRKVKRLVISQGRKE